MNSITAAGPSTLLIDYGMDESRSAGALSESSHMPGICCGAQLTVGLDTSTRSQFDLDEFLSRTEMEESDPGPSQTGSCLLLLAVDLLVLMAAPARVRGPGFKSLCVGWKQERWRDRALQKYS